MLDRTRSSGQMQAAGPRPYQRAGLRSAIITVALALGAAACGGDSAPSATTLPPVEASNPSSPTTQEPGPEPTAGDRPLVSQGDSAIRFEWVQLSDTRIGDQVFALGDGFVGYEFPLATETVVSNDGLEWTPAEISLGSPGVGVDPTYISRGGPGYFGFGMAFDDHVLVSRDGLTWDLYDHLNLQIPDLGLFDVAEVESLVVGAASMVLVGRMDRSTPDEHSFFAWTSPDGVAWRLVDDAFGLGWVNTILPIGNGFVAHGFVEGEDGGGRIWTSADGRVWEEHSDTLDDESHGIVGHQSLAIWDDRVVAVDRSDSEMRLWASSDGRTWELLPAGLTVDDPRYDLRVGGVWAGPLGVMVGAEVAAPPPTPPPVVLEKGGIVLRVDYESATLVVTDAGSGATLIEVSLAEFFEGNSVDGVDIDDDKGTITITHPATGERTTITGEEFEEAATKALEEAGFDPEEFGEPKTTRVLWFSPDGSHWTTIDIEETFGRDDFPGDVIVGTDAVILRWEDHPDFMEFEGELGEQAPPVLEDEPEHIVWVGTLAGP